VSKKTLKGQCSDKTPLCPNFSFTCAHPSRNSQVRNPFISHTTTFAVRNEPGVSRNNYLCAGTHLHLSVLDTQPSNISLPNAAQNPLSEPPFRVPFIVEHTLKLRRSKIIWCSSV